ncbi:MAG: NmrA family NAD(P)-binding protein [Desulfobacteraceae bacterium]|nr:NmrA family NAD(P)-binding protein [Desulfobacteraceae bacterium]
MYAIIGATGNIGSRVADILLSKGEKVRVIGRDTGRLQQYVDRGAEAAAGDLQDTSFLTGAFKGVEAVFAMIPPNYSALNFRAYQDVVGLSIATAISTAGVSHVVNLSSQGADLPRGTGPILGLRDQEIRLNALHGVQVLHLRPTYFMENLLANVPLIHEHGFAGSAVRGDLKFAMIATADIAERVAGHLLARDFTGSSVRDLLGQRDLSLQEAFTIIGRRIGILDLAYRQFGYDEFGQALLDMGMSRDVSRLFIEMSDALNRGLFAVNRPRNADNTTPTTIETFAGWFAEVYRGAELRRAA